jgi:hypothetical protein
MGAPGHDDPHVHLIVRYDGGRQREELQRELEPAARGAYREIRERQREFARDRERNQDRDREP